MWGWFGAFNFPLEKVIAYHITYWSYSLLGGGVRLLVCNGRAGFTRHAYRRNPSLHPPVGRESHKPIRFLHIITQLLFFILIPDSKPLSSQQPIHHIPRVHKKLGIGLKQGCFLILAYLYPIGSKLVNDRIGIGYQYRRVRGNHKL
jgi:hypothetical protein